MRSPIPVLLVFAVLIGGQVARAGEVATDEERARLGDTPISLAQVPDFHCHDGRHPVIDCFTSESQRDEDATSAMEMSSSRNVTTAVVGAASTQLYYYVTFYQHADFGGPSYTTWQSIPNLSTIHWNDIISSFRSLNGQRPKWFKDADYGPPSDQWVAGAQVANVGGTANDRFSSVKNVP